MSEVKKFKSALSGSAVTLEVEKAVSDKGVYLEIKERSFLVAPSDAPALMLAIGECLPPIPEKVLDGSYEAFMAVALNYLGKAVRALEAETAEAEAQAKLEAEAAELFNASGACGSDRLFLKFSDLEETTQSAWLAVARRARELNKETGQ